MTQMVKMGCDALIEEVLKKEWPDTQELRTLLEVCFYGGAYWLVMVFADEGLTQDVYDKLRVELREHADRVREEATAGHA